MYQHNFFTVIFRSIECKPKISLRSMEWDFYVFILLQINFLEMYYNTALETNKITLGTYQKQLLVCTFYQMYSSKPTTVFILSLKIVNVIFTITY